MAFLLLLSRSKADLDKKNLSVIRPPFSHSIGQSSRFLLELFQSVSLVGLGLEASAVLCQDVRSAIKKLRNSPSGQESRSEAPGSPPPSTCLSVFCARCCVVSRVLSLEGGRPGRPGAAPTWRKLKSHPVDTLLSPLDGNRKALPNPHNRSAPPSSCQVSMVTRELPLRYHQLHLYNCVCMCLSVDPQLISVPILPSSP